MPIAPRSWLFIPGDSPRKLAKARDSGADAVIIDLEDAVAPERKGEARQTTSEWLRGETHKAQQVWVRINAFDTPHWREDCDAIVAAAGGVLNGIMLPKAEGPAAVTMLGDMLGELEAEHGLAPGALGILPLVSETPRSAATIAAYCFATPPRLAGLTWGAEDLGAAIGVRRKRTADGRWTDAFRMVRAQTLLVAHALGVGAIDTLHADFRDEAGLARVASDAAADGFSGMLAIHPAQVAPINAAFAPDEASLAEARAIVAAFAANPDAGTLQIDGRMIDRPHLRQARALLGLD